MSAPRTCWPPAYPMWLQDGGSWCVRIPTCLRDQRASASRPLAKMSTLSLNRVAYRNEGRGLIKLISYISITPESTTVWHQELAGRSATQVTAGSCTSTTFDEGSHERLITTARHSKYTKEGDDLEGRKLGRARQNQGH